MPKVRELLQAAGVDVSTREGIAELLPFERHLREYSIVVY